MNILTVGLFLLQAQLASVDGVVLKPGSSEPLGRAIVSLNSVRPVARAVTEDDGRFSFRDVPPGEYRLTVDTERYGRVTYGQRRPDGPGFVLTLTGGQNVSDLRVTMRATGAITGRITGRNGEPAVNASVQAFRYAYQNGRRTLQMAKPGRTDDRGEYRLFGLPPGQYLVSAALSELANGPYLTGVLQADAIASSLAMGEVRGLVLVSESIQMANVVHRVLEDGSVQEEAWAPVYYPSAAEARYAVPVELGAGATMSGVNISIGPSRVQKIRGRVIGVNPDLRPQVSLVPESAVTEAGASFLNAAITTTTVAGSFEFSGILPGTYFLRASAARNEFISVPIPLEVTGRDIDGLEIALVPGISIGVTVLLDDAARNFSGPQPQSGVALRLIPQDPGVPAAVSNGQSQPGTGRLSIPGVTPGNYQVQIQDAGPATGRRLHIKTVRYGNKDASEGIQVAASPSLLEVVLTNESGAIQGKVSGAGQAVAAGATVVLVPEKSRSRAELYSATITDSAGSFHLDDIAPGEYRLFAWDDVENGAWQDPEFLRKFEGRGQRVTISGNSRQEVQLTLISSL